MVQLVFLMVFCGSWFTRVLVLLWGFLFGVWGFFILFCFFWFLYSFLVSFGFLVLFSSFPGFTTALQAASWGFTPHPFFFLLLLGNREESTPLTTTLYYYSYYQGIGSFTLLPSTESQTIASLTTTMISQHLHLLLLLLLGNCYSYYYQGSSIVLFSSTNISCYYWERSLEQAAFSAGCSRWF